jgi:hypothetical protein
MDKLFHPENKAALKVKIDDGVFIIGNETHTFFDEMCKTRRNTSSVLDHQENFYSFALKFRRSQCN